MYYALGPDALERASVYIRDYYAFMGQRAELMANSIPSTPEAIKAPIEAFTDIGVDEVMLWPCIPELDQVDRLAEIVSQEGHLLRVPYGWGGNREHARPH